MSFIAAFLKAVNQIQFIFFVQAQDSACACMIKCKTSKALHTCKNHRMSKWLPQAEDVSLNESTHTNTLIPQDSGRGGGVAAIYNFVLLIYCKPKLNYR